MERALHFANDNKWDEFKNESSHIPYSKWIPSENMSWLILELEMNITIRDIQIRVANHMIKPNLTTNNSTIQSIVMQMNMGEGKTSVILPMLCVSLSSSNSSLVRIIVLKFLFPTNHQSLRYKLGGLLNRQALDNCDIVLTSPEDILSFDLLTIDQCRQKEFNVASSMLTVQRWLKKFVRDILDESDEILHVKYQLVYTVGDQQQLDGCAERWRTIQIILDLVKKHAEDISKCFNEDVFYEPSKRKSAFPQFRLQSHKPFSFLCRKVADDWINSRNYRYEDKQRILAFISEETSSVEHLEKHFPQNDIQLSLIVRVNYGINPNTTFNCKMAVPFRAKDVAPERTESGHPDVALVLTHLTYYYSGLNDQQLLQCFNRLDRKEADATLIYDQWILYDNEDEIPPSIQKWKSKVVPRLHIY
ncbi:unnamed protein product [Rotaria sp. Silwood2]|nr:unnamed protein product [Rotaria sp. Silwood2]CAF4542777.1 unnamed protein product [Rotaria sp. Silwood2]